MLEYVVGNFNVATGVAHLDAIPSIGEGVVVNSNISISAPYYNKWAEVSGFASIKVVVRDGNVLIS